MGLKDSSARVTRDSVSCDSLAAGTVLRENPTDDSTSAEQTPESASAAYVMLDKIDHSFHEAVGKIQHCGVIGLAGHGAYLGRNGRLSLMQIATPECVYIFDMLWIGDRAFLEGLRDVLESKRTLKVMFNCRSMSDILWHQFAVNLTHVFDCQVAVVMLERQHCDGRYSRYLPPLPNSLMHYLRLTERQVFFNRVRLYAEESDIGVWFTRPLTRKILDAAAKNVQHFCPTGSSGSTSSGLSDELDTITAGKGGRGGECDAAAGTSPGVANAGDDIRRATRRPRLTEAGGPNP